MSYAAAYPRAGNRGRLTRALALLTVLWAMLLAPARAQEPPQVVDLVLGTSVQGRPITALRVGSGPRKLVLVGATHGGPERNTFQLATELAAHFRANPAAVPSGVRLYIIPTLNPDGLALDIRQNANGVDLNRNMDTRADTCPANDWQHTVEGAYGIVSDTGGPFSESEPESRLIRDFLLDASGVVFIHTSGGVVFPACEHAPSAALARVYAAAAGYPYIPKWDLSEITGGMHDWAGGLGIPAITPELATGDQPETDANLRAVQAVLGQAEALLLLPEARFVAGVPVQPVIWRAWQAWGGEKLFGLPLGPATAEGNGWRQIFERAILVYQPDRADTTGVVEVEPLRPQVIGDSETTPAPPVEGARFFPETQHNLAGLFAQFWEVYGGASLFGMPVTEEHAATENGMPIVHQVFERAILTRPAQATSMSEVTLGPVGRIDWAQLDAVAPTARIRPR